jgi:hypothetical protein
LLDAGSCGKIAAACGPHALLGTASATAAGIFFGGLFSFLFHGLGFFTLFLSLGFNTFSSLFFNRFLRAVRCLIP